MHQVQKAEVCANVEKNERATLEKKQTRIIQSYNNLNNFHQIARHEYKSLKLAFKRLTLTKTEESRKQEYAEYMLACEKYTRDQFDKNFAKLMIFMKMLVVNFHILANERFKLSEEEKKAEN